MAFFLLRLGCVDANVAHGGVTQLGKMSHSDGRLHSRRFFLVSVFLFYFWGPPVTSKTEIRAGGVNTTTHHTTFVLALHHQFAFSHCHVFASAPCSSNVFCGANNWNCTSEDRLRSELMNAVTFEQPFLVTVRLNRGKTFGEFRIWSSGDRRVQTTDYFLHEAFAESEQKLA